MEVAIEEQREFHLTLDYTDFDVIYVSHEGAQHSRSSIDSFND